MGGDPSSPPPIPNRAGDSKRTLSGLVDNKRGNRSSRGLDVGGDEAVGESAMGSVNVGVSQSGAVPTGGWGMSRPSSPGHSPGASPSHRQKQADPSSPRSNSPPLPAGLQKANTPSSTPGQPGQPGPAPAGQAPAEKQPRSSLPQVQASGTTTPQQRASLTGAARPSASQNPSSGQLLKQRPATPPLRSPTRASSLAAVLKVPEQPQVPKRLWVYSPKAAMVEGKYLQSSTSPAEWSNPEVGKVYYTGTRWCIGAFPAQPSLSSSPLGRQNSMQDAVEKARTPSLTGSLSAVFHSEPCEQSVLPTAVREWQLVLSPEAECICGEGDIKVTPTPGKYFLWEQEIAGIGDPHEFENALEAGIGELEEHIYISHKLAYIDNVGSMYRLPRNNPPGSTPAPASGSASPSTGGDPANGGPTNTKWFDIGEFLRYLYSPEGLGWLDGRPAVLAAMIYVDRIRARGRIVSRRSVHRLLTAAVLVGHEYFTRVMQDAGDCNVEPAPLNEMCEMVYLTPDQIEPLTTRFRGMLDFEQKVLETDVTAYCGALRGGVELNQTLRDEAKKERVPGQQGLSSHRDGMDAIRQWVDDSLVSCHRNLQIPAGSGSSRSLAKKHLSQHRLGGSASRVALVVLQKVKNANTSRPQPVSPTNAGIALPAVTAER